MVVAGDVRYVNADVAKHLEKVAEIEAMSYPEDEAAHKDGIRMRMLEAGDFFVVSERSGEVAGFINGTLTTNRSLTHNSMSKHEPDGTTLCVHSVVTAPDLRRKGFATTMLKQYVQNILAMRNADGKPRVTRIALITKEYLKGFYASCGFNLVGLSSIVHGKDPWYEMIIDNST